MVVIDLQQAGELARAPMRAPVWRSLAVFSKIRASIAGVSTDGGWP
jgi:hypothetical protein